MWSLVRLSLDRLNRVMTILQPVCCPPPIHLQVRARWLRERSSQRRLEQQLLTLKAAADEIVQSWAIQFYGAKSSTRFLRNNSKWSGVKRTGF